MNGTRLWHWFLNLFASVNDANYMRLTINGLTAHNFAV